MPPRIAQTADGMTHEFPEGTPDSVMDAAMKQYASGQGGSNDNTADESSGAPAAVRAAVGAMPDDPKDRLQALKKFYPDAEIKGDGNFVFTNPKTGKKTLYNPAGIDVGDFASLLPELGEFAGGTAGAIGGAVAGAAGGTVVAPGPGTAIGGIAGGMAGAGAGATAAREAITRGAMKVMGVNDARDTTQQIKDAAATFALNTVAQGAGSGLAAAGKGVVKVLARGGKGGKAATQQAVDDMARFGVTPSAAQATQNAAMDTAESFVSKIPGGAGVIRKAAQAQSEQVAAAMDAKVAALNKGVVPDVMAAGNATDAGVKQFASDFGDRADVLYGKLDSFLAPNTAVQVSNTAKVLTDVAEPVAGAENFSKSLINPKLKEMLVGLAQDAQAGNGSLPYSAVSAMRSKVGRMLGSASLHDDIPRAELKLVYGALTADMRTAAQGVGGDALKAFDRANTYYSAGIKRIDTMLDPLVRNKLPEQAFAAVAASANQGPSRIIALRKSVSPDQWKVIAGTVAQRLGKAKPGYQGVEAENFSFQNFLANWQKLPLASRDALFSGPNMGGIREDMDALARASDRIRVSSSAFANPSGTGGVAIGGTMLMSAIGAALGGTPGALAAPAAAMGGANLAARLFTSPKFVRWLAQSTRIAPAGVAAHIARLGAIAKESDPDTRDAIMGLMGGLQNTQDQQGTNQ